MLFALDITVPSGDILTIIGSIVTAFVGVIIWIFKSAFPTLIQSHRDDVFKLHAECDAERKADRDRYDAMVQLRDNKIQQMTDTIITFLKESKAPTK